MVVNPLEVEQFRQVRDHNEGIVIEVARPWLIDQFIGKHIFIVYECLGNLLPVVGKLVKEFVLIRVQSMESLVY